MKKLLVMLLALIMCFGMAACGQKDSPSDALKADMENAKSGAEDLMGDLDDSLGEEAGQAFIDKMLDFDYKLGEESVDGDTATVGNYDNHLSFRRYLFAGADRLHN